MGKKTRTTDTIEVLTPIWVLKAKVEQDWEQYRLTSAPTIVFDEDVEDEVEMDDIPVPFPEFDSTAKCLEILENHGIYFNTKGGYWEDK